MNKLSKVPIENTGMHACCKSTGSSLATVQAHGPCHFQRSGANSRQPRKHSPPTRCDIRRHQEAESHAQNTQMAASLVSSFKGLSLATAAIRSGPRAAQQIRTLSQATLATTRSGSGHNASLQTRISQPLRTTVSLQQTRGMKVQSSIKKRCEHCKVRFALDDGGARSADQPY